MCAFFFSHQDSGIRDESQWTWWKAEKMKSISLLGRFSKRNEGSKLSHAEKWSRGKKKRDDFSSSVFPWALHVIVASKMCRASPMGASVLQWMAWTNREDTVGHAAVLACSLPALVRYVISFGRGVIEMTLCCMGKGGRISKLYVLCSCHMFDTIESFSFSLLEFRQKYDRSDQLRPSSIKDS